MAQQRWILISAVVLSVGPMACFVAAEGPSGTGGGYTHTHGTAGAQSAGAGGGTGGGAVGDACNPVTSGGCGAGEVCDLDVDTNYFQCYGGSNTVNVGGTCDNTSLYCGAELTCIKADDTATSGKCFRYCCTDADCGTGGACNTSLAQSALPAADTRDQFGVCVATGTTTVPGVGAPTGAPSKGACIGGYGTSSVSDAGVTASDAGVTASDAGVGASDAGSTAGDGGVVVPTDGGFALTGDGGWAGGRGHGMP